MRTFLAVWLGQVLSMTGTSLTGFALGVWVYQRTGSVTSLALISVAAVLPGMLLGPLVGDLIDRRDRRHVMLAADLVAGLSTLAMAALYRAGSLEPWHILTSVGLNSICTALQAPAWAAATSLLVPTRHLARASGLIQLGQGAAMLVGPATAGALLGLIGVGGIFIIDVVTFLLAVGSLLLVRFPPVPQADALPSPWRGAREGWAFIAARPGLLGLLAFTALSNLCLGMVHVLITPLVLGFTDPATLGALMSTGGVGMLLGSLLMVAWGGPRRRVAGVLGFSALQGALLLLGGLRPSVWLVGAGAFGALLAFPLVQACAQTLWQLKTPPDLQGRVFSVRNALTAATLPLAYLAAGPLADHAFEPLLRPHGPLTPLLGSILGVGPGRGVGLLFVALGLVAITAAALAWAWPPLRRLEDELPDQLPTEPAQTQETQAISTT